MMADEIHGPGDFIVFDGSKIGGLPGYHGIGFNGDDLFGGADLAIHHFVEQSGRFKTRPAVTQGHAGDPGDLGFTDGPGVIDTEDGDLLGDQQFGNATGPEDVHCQDVIAGHNRRRFGKRFEPVGQGVDFLVPCREVFRPWVNDGADGKAGILQAAGETLGAFSHGYYIFVNVIPVKFKTPGHKMVGGHFADSGSVTDDGRPAGDSFFQVSVDDDRDFQMENISKIFS